MKGLPGGPPGGTPGRRRDIVIKELMEEHRSSLRNS